MERNRLLAAADLPDLLARHADLFDRLAFPDASRPGLLVGHQAVGVDQ